MKGLQKEKKDASARRDQPSGPRQLRAGLLRWFQDQQRALPWREDRDPYRVMVSEFMLQQTRVEVVEPRFREFLRRFPSVDDLARSTRDEVHDQWSGLGYYRRADLLHAAARAIVDNGGFPRNAKELECLPGFGPYTAAAVASIAFGEVVAVLDGNVERVSTRILAEAAPPKRAAVRRRLLAQLQEWIDPDRPGDFNQAMMELGATICRPKAPRCGLCPLEAWCSARAEGRPTDYPTQVVRRPRESWRWTQFVVFDGERKAVQLVRRGEASKQLAGRWELPGFRAPQAGRSDVEGGARELGLVPGEMLGVFDHSITQRDYRVELIQAYPATEGATVSGRSVPQIRWAQLNDFDVKGRWQGKGPLPVSSMLAKAIERIRTRFV